MLSLYSLGRLEVDFLPEGEPQRDLGSVTAFQQREELRLLRALAAATAAPEATAQVAEAAHGPATPAQQPAAPEGPASDVDLLAAWLIQQADLSDL